MAIKDANEAVKVIATNKLSKSRGTYCKISPENQAAITKYATEQAIRQLFVILLRSLMWT